MSAPAAPSSLAPLSCSCATAVPGPKRCFTLAEAEPRAAGGAEPELCSSRERSGRQRVLRCLPKQAAPPAGAAPQHAPPPRPAAGPTSVRARSPPAAPAAVTSKLILFYSESHKAYSPGGDIKYITSADAGETWAPPVTIYTHEADGECPKLAANKPVVDRDGTWYLAVSLWDCLGRRAL